MYECTVERVCRANVACEHSPEIKGTVLTPFQTYRLCNTREPALLSMDGWEVRTNHE